MARVDAVESHLHLKSEKNGTPVMAEVDRKVKPILSSFTFLGGKEDNLDHPTQKLLFNWLIDPHRTGQEFCYVINILQRRVYQKTIGYCEYVYREATKALAMKCPILVGPWEEVAMALAYDTPAYNKTALGAASDSLTAWIINMIGDPELCPNPMLRIHMMSMLYKMVDLTDQNWKQAFESVMYAFSFLESGDVISHQMELSEITDTLFFFAKTVDVNNNKHLCEFDEKFAEKLHNVKSSRLTAIVHDFANNYAVNSNTYVLSKALYGLEALLKTIVRCVQQVKLTDEYSQTTCMDETKKLLCVILKNFNKSCQTPQLVGLTASGIKALMDLGKTVNRLNPDVYGQHLQRKLLKINKLLCENFDEKDPLRMGYPHLTANVPGPAYSGASNSELDFSDEDFDFYL